MHSIRKYRNWAVLLLAVFAATAVAGQAPGSAAQLNAALTSPGGTALITPGLPATGIPSQNQSTAPQYAPRRPTDQKYVAFMGAEYDPLATRLYDSLTTVYGHTVDRIPCVAYTPTLDEMNAYDAIIAWSNYAWADPTAIGDRFADYVDGGGRLIMFTFCWYSSPGWGIAGRIKTDDDYQTFNYSASFDFTQRTTGWYDGGHPITQDMDQPINTYYHHSTTVHSSATELARYNNDLTMVALSPNEEVVGINFYMGNDIQYTTHTGPWARLVHNAIEFGSGPPLDDDVGINAIRLPAAVQDPGVPVAPLIRIKNFGANPQNNVPVHVLIHAPDNSLVYDELEYSGAINMGDTTSVGFPNWVPGAWEYYTVTAITELVGDEKTKNDTASRRVATIGWKDVPPPGDETHRLTHGTIFDHDNDMLYMVGGCAAGQSGTNVASLHRYDPVVEEWTKMASMPTPRGWISGAYAGGKIVVVGGLSNSSTALNNNEVYDPASNSWSTGTACPRNILAYSMGVYDNRLVYLMGGYNMSSGTAVVDIYDPASNSWTTGTNLPANSDMASATIVGDTIYIAQAYNRSTGQCWANMYKGAIDPGNPSSITWIQGPALSDPIFNGGTAAIDENVYWMGGFINAATVTNKLYKYSQETGAIENYSIANYPNTLARNDFLVARMGALSELYCLAGDLDGNWGEPNNLYKRLTLPSKDNDYGVTMITSPTNAQLTPGSTVTPSAWVKNHGQVDQTDVPVRLIITDADGVELYNEELLASLAAGDSAELVFPDFLVDDELFIGRVFTFRTLLVDDQRPNNDAKSIKAMTLSDEVYSYPGASAPDIDGYFEASEWADAYSFDCSNIFGWRGGVRGPGAAYAYFKNDASYLYVAMRMPEAELRNPGDAIGLAVDENNDGAWGTDLFEGEYLIWVNNSSADEVQFRWHNPSTYGQFGAVAGASSASGTTNGYLVFEARIPIGTQPNRLTINPANDTVGLWLYAVDGGSHYGWFRAGLASDDWRDVAQYGKLVILTLQSGNVGVTNIVRPPSAVQPGTEIIPEATYRNTSSGAMNFTTWMFLEDPLTDTRVYGESQSHSLAAGATVNLTFPPFTVNELGNWVAKCSLYASGDNNPGDDQLEKPFRVTTQTFPPGWVEVANAPGPVKDGGWLTFNEGNGLIYGGRGYKSLDFYSHDPMGGTNGLWATLPAVPAGAKPCNKGTQGTSDGGNYIYLAKGNNTFEFYRYAIEGASGWEQLADVPPGTSGKKVKVSDLVYVPGGDSLANYVYMIKGNKSDFMRFNTGTLAWEPLPDAPAGAKPKWDKGSFLVYDNVGTIYAHKARYMELWAFDIASGTWGAAALPGMPLMGKIGKSKKAKDGSGGAFDNGAIHALKGGNTQEFWKYDVAANVWTEHETIPAIGSTGKKKRVKNGGDVTRYADDVFFAFKGNKTTEFWRYVIPVAPAAKPLPTGVMAGETPAAQPFVKIGPNPLANGLATLRYALPAAGPASINVFDVSGRTVLSRSLVATRSGAVSLDLRSLSAGIYLVKVEAAGFTGTQKLVIQH